MRRIYGIAAVVIAMALILTTTGCAQVAQQATKAAVENATGVKVDENSGKTTITGKDGSQATLSGAEGKLPENLPSDVPTYQGTVKNSAEISTDKGTNYSFAILTDDGAQTIVDWYKKQLADKGWTLAGAVVSGENGMVNAKNADDTAEIVVTIGKNDSEGPKTQIATMVGIKKK